LFHQGGMESGVEVREGWEGVGQFGSGGRKEKTDQLDDMGV